MSCQILERQSTYWDIVDLSGIVRIHFRQKEEVYFSQPIFDGYQITEDHPLLLEYRAHWESLFVASSAARPAEIVSEIVEAWEPQLLGWRTALDYLTDTDPERMLAEGFGSLMAAPAPLVELAADVLRGEGIDFTILPSRNVRGPRKALIAGKNFVIASTFEVEARAA